MWPAVSSFSFFFSLFNRVISGAGTDGALFFSEVVRSRSLLPLFPLST